MSETASSSSTSSSPNPFATLDMKRFRESRPPPQPIHPTSQTEATKRSRPASDSPSNRKNTSGSSSKLNIKASNKMGTTNHSIPANHDTLNDTLNDEKKPPKRPREQYSCVECFRRKQKCDRRFPCNNCIKRRLPERCVPPPSARSSMSATAADISPSLLAIRASPQFCPEPSLEPSPAKKMRIDQDTWDDRKMDDLARTTARIARLERILALHDSSYLEQRLALAEKAVRSRLGEDSTGAAQSEFQQRTQASRDSRYSHEDTDQDKHGVGHLDENEGFLGTSALEAVRMAPQLQNDFPSSGISPSGKSPQELLSYISPSPTRRGFPIPSADVQAIRATLPSSDQCDRYFDAFFANYNWARSPVMELPLRERYKQLFSTSPTPSAIRVDAETLPFVALILSIMTLGSVPPAAQPLSSATSHAFFWATKKALILCETLGLASLDSCWAHATLVRYLDVIRVTRASWHEIGSWIRDALDLGLHRDGSSFGLPKEQVAARRILWSHVLHNDREWSILLGRPLTITFHTTEMPTREDLEHLGFACQTYFLARNRFTACLEAITLCFQERSQTHGSSAARTSRAYYRVLEVDDMIAEFWDSLPPFLAPSSTGSGKTKLDTSLDEHHPLLPYYRHLINTEVCFYRSLLHRPYLLRPAVNGKHPFPESRRVCVETALSDLRARKDYARKLSNEQTAQAFGGAYATFNSAIVVGLSLLTAFSLGEKIHPADLRERLGYLQDYIAQLRRNFEAGNVDASVEKERMVMETLLNRLDPILPEELTRSSRSELAAAAQSSLRASGTLRDPRKMDAHEVAKHEDDEQQVLDSLRMLSGAASPAVSHASIVPGSFTNQARTGVEHHNAGQSPMTSGSMHISHTEAGPGSTFSSITIGIGAPPANVNPIDPYGWLLTPSALQSHDDSSSGSPTSNNTPADGGCAGPSHHLTPPSHRGNHPSGSYLANSTATAASCQDPSAGLMSSADQQAAFDWEGILQTIGSGWVGDGTMEPSMDNLFS